MAEPVYLNYGLQLGESQQLQPKVVLFIINILSVHADPTARLSFEACSGWLCASSQSGLFIFLGFNFIIWTGNLTQN